MRTSTTGAWSVVLAGVCLLATVGCDDDDNPASPPEQTGSGGQGASSSGGAGGGGAGGGASGGAGGTGGGVAGGGSGCLPTSVHDAVFSVDEAGLCVVASYSVAAHLGFDPNTFVSTVPTWGSHGGPLTLTQTYDTGVPIDEITLTRWSPGAPGSELTVGETVGPITLGTSDPNPYMNPTAVDLPFEGWTAVGWATFGGSAGELLLLAGDTVDQVWPIEGMFGVVGVSDGDAGERLLLSALSPLDAAGAATAGLYYADVCSGPALCGGGAATQTGDASGVTVRDGAGNVFATFPNIAAGTQTVYGYHNAEIAPGTAAQGSGTALFTGDGSGTAIAAIAPSGSSDGYLLLQPFDGNTFMALNVVVQRYASDASTVSATGATSTALTLASAGTEVTLMADDADRIWVGVANGDGSSTFFVLAAAP